MFLFCFFCVFLVCCSACFCFSLENDATHAKHAQACFFCSAFFAGLKNETFLKSVSIPRFCTGKREVVCKKHYNLCFFRKTSVFLKKATQRTRSKKKQKQKNTHQGVFFFFVLRVRSPPPRSLTHSLALGSLTEITI